MICYWIPVHLMLHRMLRTSYIPLISCSHISQPRSAGESSSSYSVAEHYLTGWHLACVGVLKVKVLVDSLDRLPTSSCPSMQHLLMMSLSSACNNNISCIHMHTIFLFFLFFFFFLFQLPLHFNSTMPSFILGPVDCEYANSRGRSLNNFCWTLINSSSSISSYHTRAKW